MGELFSLYSVYDKVAMKYGPIFQAVNAGTATRQFRRLIDDVGEHSRNDFILFLIGKFDDVTGKIMSCDQPVLMVKSEDFVRKFDDLPLKANEMPKILEVK